MPLSTWYVNCRRQVIPLSTYVNSTLVYLLLLPGKVPDPPGHVLQPRVPLLRAPHRRCLKPTSRNRPKEQSHQKQNRAQKPRNRHQLETTAAGGERTYSDPGLVKVSLVETGDDLLDEVSRGAEPAALPEHQRRLVPLLSGRPLNPAAATCGSRDFPRGPARVEDSLQVAIDPVVPRHHAPPSLARACARSLLRRCDSRCLEWEGSGRDGRVGSARLLRSSANDDGFWISWRLSGTRRLAYFLAFVSWKHSTAQHSWSGWIPFHTLCPGEVVVTAAVGSKSLLVNFCYYY